MKSFLKLFAVASLLISPITVLAQDDANDVIWRLATILDALVPILIGLALILFIYGIFKYVITSDEKTKTEAVNVIIYGVITLFVMVAVWGLVNLLIKTFHTDLYFFEDNEESVENLKP